MKTIFIFLSLFLSFHIKADELVLAQQVLATRSLSLDQLKQNGAALLLGEVTGAGLTIKDLEMVLTRDQVIFKHEIESVAYTTGKQQLSELDSLRAFGMYFLKEDIVGLVVKKKL